MSYSISRDSFSVNGLLKKLWLSIILFTYINCMIYRFCWPTMSATTPCLMSPASNPAAMHSVTLYQGWTRMPL